MRLSEDEYRNVRSMLEGGAPFHEVASVTGASLAQIKKTASQLNITEPEPQQELTYKVTFLLTRTITVSEIDEIQAELAAARKLSPAERKRAVKAKWATADDGSDFYTIDKDWWSEWL